MSKQTSSYNIVHVLSNTLQLPKQVSKDTSITATTEVYCM